jgi:hypothetical protein
MRESALLALNSDACAYVSRAALASQAVHATLLASGGSATSAASLSSSAAPATERARWPARVAATPEFASTGFGATPFEAVLADSAVKYFVVTPPKGLQRFAELRDLAQMRVAELFGTDSAQWRIGADWNARQPFLCCATPADLIAPLQSFAGSKLVSAAPIFVRRYNAAAHRFARGGAWFVCAVGSWVTAGYFEAGACHTVRSTALAQRDALARWLGQEALLANRPLTEVWLADAAQEGLTLSGANVHRIDAKPHELRDLQLLAALAARATDAVPA